MRALLAGLLALLAASAPAQDYPPLPLPLVLEFPRDHGAHPEQRIEWWYLTGWLRTAEAAPIGFQITFFRVRPRLAEDSPSRFAPRQLLFAHAALSDPAVGRLQHAQRAAREGFGLAGALPGRTAVWIDDWRLEQIGARYRAHIETPEFAYTLEFVPPAAPLRHGWDGYSRKGPDPRHASAYYSRPQLVVSGTLRRAAGPTQPVSGRAWLDHEWSSTLMPQGAVGWDWVGLNLDDGGALMAFRLRDAAGAPLWAGGTLLGADGAVQILTPEAVEFDALRRWRSPRTGAEYPVAWRVRAGARTIELEPLFDDQELDARSGIGALYWEGALRARANGVEIGRGYLELTGYGERLRM